MVVIDADGKILGRLATMVVAHLNDGDEVHVINAEKAVVTGRKEDVFEEYRQKRERGNRDHGPYFPERADRILKHSVRGMLPDTEDGRQAFKKLRTYQGNPEDLDADDVDVKSTGDLQGRNYVTMQEITDHM